ncbi:F-box domain-containing protein [Favolaschia claudopus]|uniref:F-box domain-containing protein n=1 Tax=Favolaschia claudopus TaxID=2862362 RepID=A0AAW0A909_9AGAR
MSQSSQPLAMEDIPPETLSEIFSFLDAKSLLVCYSVCRLWNELVHSSSDLQCKIELWADGMEPEYSLPTSETLEALISSRRAWKNLEWTSEVTLEMESLWISRAYELVGGLFLQQQQRAPTLLSVSFSRGRAPRITTTPSSAEALEGFHDLAIDPTQDLIVWFSWISGEYASLECRTISTGEDHPLADESVLTFELDRNPLGSFTVQIADDVVAIFFRGTPSTAHLFNWKTSVEIAEFSDTEFREEFRTDFHLLSPRSYLFAHGSDAGPGQIDIFTFEADDYNDPILVGTLELPKLLPGIGLTNVMIHTGPFCAKPIAGSPFSKSNEHRIYMFMLCYDLQHWCRLFVPFRYLHKFVLDADRIGEQTRVATLAWDEWGSQNSRLLPGSNHQWNRQVHGERVALPCDDPTYVHALDFGVRPQRKENETPEEESNSPLAALSAELFVGSEFFTLDGVFQNSILTALPYRSLRRKLDRSHDMFLMDQDRILAMNTSPFSSSPDKVTVYTF